MSLAGAGATCPGGPGPVLVSASDHQHLSPHIEGSVHQEADHWPHGHSEGADLGNLENKTRQETWSFSFHA